MVSSRKNVLEKIIQSVSCPSEDASCKKIILLTGNFGTGKSWLTGLAENEIDSNSLADAVLRLEQSKEMGYLPEFLNNAVLSYKANYSKGKSFTSNETSYNMVRYLELLNIIKQDSPELFQDVLSSFVLKSDADIHLLEGDYQSTQDTKERLTREIKSVIERKGDQRLLLETAKVAAESFIVDLMTNFFASNISEPHAETPKEGKKKKIVFIIDSYEHISGSINKWLTEEFFHYCYERSFGEFVAYNISNIPPKTKVSDFFDFRFIITNRRDPVFAPELSEWSRFESISEKLKLSPLTKTEIEELIESTGFKKEISLDKLLAHSFGIPYLVLLWLEYLNLGGNENDKKPVFLKASECILKYSTEEQQEWIRCASFLNDFEENGLRCFPFIGENHKIAFSFFAKSPDLASRSADFPKRMECNPIIKEIISETLSLESFNLAKEYVSIARIYNEIKDVFYEMNSEEVNVARSLAYFNHFDDIFAIEKAFQSDAYKARSFIAGHQGWFDKTKYTLKLKPEISVKMMKFNKIIDKDRQIDKMNLIGQIWEDYEKKLKRETHEAQDSLSQINQEIISAEKENNQQKTIYDSYQKEFIEKENSLIELRKKLGFFSSRQNFVSSATNLFVSAVIYFFGNLFPDLVGTTENQDSVEIGQYIIWFISFAFLIVSFSKAINGAKIFSRRSELKELKEKIRISEADKSELQEKMRIVREGKEIIQKSIVDVYDRLKNTNSKIRENQDKLNEPFIV